VKWRGRPSASGLALERYMVSPGVKNSCLRCARRPHIRKNRIARCAQGVPDLAAAASNFTSRDLYEESRGNV
jgi:hypothetical protein